MNGELIIRLTEDDHASWLPVDAQGRALGAVQQGPLAQAAAMTTDRRVSVLVPGARVLMTRVRIPGVHGARLRNAVPFALEDQVVDDLSALHFACGTPGADGSVTVAVVDRKLMDGWMARLREAAIPVRRMLVDFSTVPVDGTPAVVVDGSAGHVLARMPDGTGFAGTAELVPALITGDDGVLVIPQGNEIPAPLSAWSNKRTLAGGLLPWLASTAAAVEPDLLQGDYAVRHRLRMPAARWRIPIGLAAAVTLVWLSGWVLEYRALANEHAQLQQRIDTRFAALVPGEPMVDARQQIMRRMGLAGAAGGDLLPLLDAISAALAESPGVELTALSYRPGAIEISVSAARADQLEQVRARIDSYGMPTTISGATSRGDGVDGRIAVRSGS